MSVYRYFHIMGASPGWYVRERQMRNGRLLVSVVMPIVGSYAATQSCDDKHDAARVADELIEKVKNNLRWSGAFDVKKGAELSQREGIDLELMSIVAMAQRGSLACEAAVTQIRMVLAS